MRRINWRRMFPYLGLALACALASGVYLWASSRLEGPGFPLDDAWIHQTYARNLARWGQWSFLRDQPSAGSTAPLWSALLAVGYGLNIDRYVWAYGLGIASLFGAALAGQTLARRLLPGDVAGESIPWVGLFLAGEWHLVWAGVSGMETTAFAALALAALACMAAARGRGWGGVGLLIGSGVWLRPDALTLLGPALWVIWLTAPDQKQRARALGWLAGGFLLLFGPYLLFNGWTQGSFWPNTFYAKQAEYAALRQSPFIERYLSLLKLPLVGGGLFLLPGFAAYLWSAFRRRDWVGVGAALWFLGFTGLYAERLPVTYQYGRYLIPAMPVYFVLGLVGLRAILTAVAERLSPAGEVGAGWKARLGQAFAKAWVFSLVGVWLGFYAIVAGFYARDVAIIETEMVATARWLAAHTPPDALLAVHDIGAVGYFSGRRMVDLAGLISPEIIPIIRDEEALARRLDALGVDYLVTLKGWYTHLPEGKEVVFQSGGRAAVEAGGENMWVYRWK